MKTIIPQTLVDQINALSRRLDNIEVGSKPISNLSSIANVGGFTVGAGGILQITTTLSWVDTNITAQPKGQLYIAVYVDTDNTAGFQYPFGGSLSASQKNMRVEQTYDLADLSNNTNRSRCLTRIVNMSADSHDYYVYTGWVYLGGGSSSGL